MSTTESSQHLQSPGMTPAAFRPIQGDDDNFIAASYVRSLWEGGVNFAKKKLDIHIDKDLLMPQQRQLLHRELVGGADMQWEFNDFRDAHRKRVNRLLGESTVLLAVSPADEWFILGFAMGTLTPQALVLHYVYVRADYRKDRVASSLIARLADGRRHIVATHRTCGWDDIAGGGKHPLRQQYRLSYNPSLAMES